MPKPIASLNTRIVRHLLIIATFSVTACSSDDNHKHPNLVTGKDLYEYHCATCHRSSGAGDFLKGIPDNRRIALGDVAIKHQIQSGSGGKMPVFETMSSEELDKIVDYVKSLK